MSCGIAIDSLNKKIGKMIIEKQNGQERAKYGDGLIKELSIEMTKDFGKGFDVTNLKRMRQFYALFRKGATVRHQLSWSHYKLLIGVEGEEARNFYTNEAINGNWSTRQLEREINTFSYQRYLASHGMLKASGFRRDVCTDYLMFMDKVVDYKHWFFGHYHFDRKISDKKTCLYDSIIELA